MNENENNDLLSPSEKGSKKKMIGAGTIALMLCTSVLAFNNIPRMFYQMGYSAIIMMIAGAVLFFIPYAFMMSEYGSALKDDAGGIYNWMERSMGIKYAFVAVVMWYIGQAIWMIQTFVSIWIHFSALLFGGDTTATWSFFGLNSSATLGLLGILAVIIMTLFCIRGVRDVAWFSNAGGISVLALNVVLIIGGIIALAVNGGHVAQPISAHALVTSPNPDYQSVGGFIAFMAFAILAYGGSETVAGVTDETKNAEKNFPKGIIWGAILTTLAYCIGIFITGLFTSWGKLASQINMANAAIIIMKNLGYVIATGFGAQSATAVIISEWFARIVGLSLFITYFGGLTQCLYCALKETVQGTPEGLWPRKLIKIDSKHGTLKNALIVQCLIMIVLIALVSFGGKSANDFFNMLLIMTTVSATVPYMFISGAFPAFKKLNNIDRPFVIYKTQSSANIWAFIVTFTIGFANIFCIIEPALSGNISTTIWSIAGPVIFAVIALALYHRYAKNKGIL